MSEDDNETLGPDEDTKPGSDERNSSPDGMERPPALADLPKPRRVPISTDTPLMSAITTLAEGNPGAVVVLISLMRHGRGDLIFALDGMNMRGSQIWVAWKDHANENLAAFIYAVEIHSPEMIETVNAECAYTGEFAHA